MYKIINLIIFLVSFVAATPDAFASQTVAKHNRALNRKEAIGSFWARNLETDPCSARNVAEDVEFFFQCVKTKLPNYVIRGQGGVLQWDKSKVFAMSNGAIQTGSIPVTIANQALFTMWTSLYKEYVTLEREEEALIDEALTGEIDDAQETVDANENTQEATQRLVEFNQKFKNIQNRIISIDARWQAFLQSMAKMPAPIPTLIPNTQYPIEPDPLSPIFLTQITKSGVWLVSEQFYADLMKLLDDNPNALLQLMKYYLVENPARFRKLTQVQNTFSVADKSFKISLLCADIANEKGLILTIAAGAAPPLPYLPTRACQFSAKRIAISDNTPLSTTGTPSAGTSYSF